MNKTALAIATAASLSLFAGPLMADNDMNSSKDKDSAAMGQSESMSGTTAGTTNDPDFEPNFDRLDRNSDGQLDEEELSAYGSTAAGQGTGDGESMMNRYDKDGDGAVSEQELQQGSMSGQENNDVKTGVGIDSDEGTME